MSVRVRYAPSPTGLQHIGGLRTALFNYFFARSQGGTFILRIEDTDRERYNPDSLQDIYDTFEWLGITPDEGPRNGGAFGPYVQSARQSIYRQYAENLIESGHAYWAWDSEERLAELKRRQDAGEAPPGYDRYGRDMTEEEIAQAREAGVKPVVRFKVPTEGKTEIHDVVLGRIRKKNKDVPADPVLLKSDGHPTYHLANVVDDHLMQITHVLRAQEWIPSAPLHVLMYQAFGWEPPVYVHLPLVTGKDGQKLSKRHGSTSVIEFRRQGYLPEALLNYITLLGWSYDDSREFFTRQDLEQLFDISKLNKAPAVFDYRKLEWFNGSYIRELGDDELYARILPFVAQAGIISDPPAPDQERTLRSAVSLIRERLKLLSDAPVLVRFLFERVTDYDVSELVPKKTDEAFARTVLEADRKVLEDLAAGTIDDDDEAIESAFRQLSEDLDTRMGNVMLPLRVAVTGSTVSPPLIGSIRAIGPAEAVARIDVALTKLA